ncbi:hypothetical protein EPIR_0027 [Erwinia piriflorinigrans CFBP 5888]|uniref:Uncharacterized protein n=1 Tax=Erwinia piriflorinigrans CFBP 5888 TaxID=1161919 RepID=V5Z2M9_9GAMM|nr:hypothetical protein EPIR_0027 [Erwinia piriflorinigrans CFBP 5888]
MTGAFFIVCRLNPCHADSIQSFQPFPDISLRLFER